jgi:hypothetical protein
MLMHYEMSLKCEVLRLQIENILSHCWIVISELLQHDEKKLMDIISSGEIIMDLIQIKISKL